MAIVLWTIVSVDNQLFYTLIVFFYKRPPLLYSIADKIAGFIGISVEDMELVIFQIENSEGDHLFFGRHIMIQCFDGCSPSGFATTGKVAEIDGRFTVNTDLKCILLQGRLFFHGPDIFKDGIGFRDFFSGLVF